MSRQKDSIFRFKQFSVVHSASPMKVGTDAVLLGAWCSVADARRVLDVGTGCGVIALMIAQRNANALIHGIDIEPLAVEEAQKNFEQSPWRERLSAECVDFNDFDTASDMRFDLIVSNPPFFTNGVLPPNDARMNARHNTSLSIGQLLTNVSRLLALNGALALILPGEAQEELLATAHDCGLLCSRVTRVFAQEGGPVKRILCEFICGNNSLSGRACFPVVDTLTLAHKQNNYTEQYLALCKDFYLNF